MPADLTSMPPAFPTPALQPARTAHRVLSKLSGVVVLHSAEEELRSETALPTMVTRLTVGVKALPAAAASGDIYASPEAFAAAVLNPAADAADDYYVLDLLLSKSADDSVAALGVGEVPAATQLLKAKVIGLLSSTLLDSLQAQIAHHQSAATYEVNGTSIVRAVHTSPTPLELLIQQIEKSVKPLPSTVSQQALRELVQHASSMKNHADGIVFFMRELPFAMQQQH
jgi:hypothetical protein